MLFFLLGCGTDNDNSAVLKKVTKLELQVAELNRKIQHKGEAQERAESLEEISERVDVLYDRIEKSD